MTIDQEGVAADPDLGVRVVLRVGGEDAAGADDQVVDVGAAVADRDGMDDPPTWVLPDDLGELVCDLLLAHGTDSPGPFVRVHTAGLGPAGCGQARRPWPPRPVRGRLPLVRWWPGRARVGRQRARSPHLRPGPLAYPTAAGSSTIAGPTGATESVASTGGDSPVCPTDCALRHDSTAAVNAARSCGVSGWDSSLVRSHQPIFTSSGELTYSRSLPYRRHRSTTGPVPLLPSLTPSLPRWSRIVVRQRYPSRVGAARESGTDFVMIRARTERTSLVCHIGPSRYRVSHDAGHTRQTRSELRSRPRAT